MDKFESEPDELFILDVFKPKDGSWTVFFYYSFSNLPYMEIAPWRAGSYLVFATYAPNTYLPYSNMIDTSSGTNISTGQVCR